ncbi:MAG: hypothetical protein MUO26_06725 [Methanotrichaceae archaeon]|nr:hypothetical protein [Methanotrichaceae archaeon]
MVSFKVDAEAKAKVQGTKDMDEYPLVAKVKGTGKDGSLSVQVFGGGSEPISAKVLGDSANPISVAPISIIPDIKKAVEALDFKSLVTSLEKMAQGIRVEVSNEKGSPVSVAFGNIPIDMNISVFSPKEEPVFRIEIKGNLGGE